MSKYRLTLACASLILSAILHIRIYSMHLNVKMMHALRVLGKLPWGCVGAQCGWQEVAVVHCSCIA